MWLAVSSCLIFFTRASRLGPVLACRLAVRCSGLSRLQCFRQRCGARERRRCMYNPPLTGPDRGVERKYGTDMRILGGEFRAIEIISEWANVNGA